MHSQSRLGTVLRGIGAEMAALLLAASCAGCDEPGELLCAACRVGLMPRPVEIRTPQGLAVRAALPFEGVPARCIRRLKDSGESSLVRPLGRVLSAVLDGASSPDALIVPVPTSRAAFRRRGYRVPELLARCAGASPHRLLAVASRRADQRGLDARSRRDNVQGSMHARRRGHAERVILVDDVVTTGATLDEAANALTDAGFDVLFAVALAATPRHRRLIEDSSATRRK
ncbi:ComF family protein [Microbacterium sp. SSW1-49]|uniref:ComF family protein n=1 Tax=Microbacterium croceum TaxID=2851645 RepID=A0ABT0FE62_9MICO|nr:phosphoribosyltransferase family protein [Microbacterium croceum]MCK2036358.1 ComF family protein [Microbacterium croceum]